MWQSANGDVALAGQQIQHASRVDGSSEIVDFFMVGHYTKSTILLFRLAERVRSIAGNSKC